MSYYYTDVHGLTAEDYQAAGNKAAKEYNDTWFACDVAAAEGQVDTGTVFTEYKGIVFEVWLDQTWGQAKRKEINGYFEETENLSSSMLKTNYQPQA